MQTYDSLLLSCGGGIINDREKSDQYRGAAALAIGIGGTGVAALAQLKRKVYQQLKPDDPESDIPQYKHIQFLAIDSDEGDIDQMRGRAKLSKTEEFQSLYYSDLKGVLKAKDRIKRDPRYSWMDIERLNELLDGKGAGGVRQMGRYLLISRVSELQEKIRNKCTLALENAGTANLDVYIFAGISGGTGSGCFLDTCYIVQKTLEQQGKRSGARIMGFFFLPDVAISKPDVGSDPGKVKYNSSNGYAAMKELDYLMSLKTAKDRFYQNYGPFIVDTQEAPVDMCHLISAKKADGTEIKDGFQYAINVAADYAMAYLANVQLPTAGEGDSAEAAQQGLTMRGHLANVDNGVSQIPRQYGANLSYHILGAANAEIPMDQISSYLAAGFMRRFQHLADKSNLKLKLSKAKVDDWVYQMELESEDVRRRVTKDTYSMDLPSVDLKDLKSYGTMPRGKLPQCWASVGNDWLDRSAGKRAQNRAALEGQLRDFLPGNAVDDSLLGKTFKKLCEIAKDPAYGPYYADRLLSCEGYDLIAAVEGAITTLEEQRSTQLLQLHGRDGQGGIEEDIVQCSSDFFHKANKKNYTRYYDTVRRYYDTTNRVNEYADTLSTLNKLKADLKELYQNYFAPLCELLDRLSETFELNEKWLGTAEAKAPVAYTRRILQLSDIQPHLNEVIDALTDRQLVNDFMDALMKYPEAWRLKDENQITRLVTEYMVNRFSGETNRSLEDYLYQKYPAAGGDPVLLAQEIQANIIQPIYNDAQPMFWRAEGFDLSNAQNSFSSSSLSVPASAAAICKAGKDFAKSRPEFYVRETGLKNRIFALRFLSGLPFYAYQGVSQLKEAYDSSASAQSGVGAHLYSYTNRGEDGSGMKDWRNFLPAPSSYSFDKKLTDQDKAENAQALYQQGEDAGVITQNAQNDYVIRRSGETQVPAYTLSAFLRDDVLDLAALTAEKSRLEGLKAGLYDPAKGASEVLLKNDGDAKLCDPRVVRMDYFIHYPVLQQIVREELDKLKQLGDGIQALEDIQAAYEKYEKELDVFCNQLFFGIIRCENAQGHADPVRIHRVFYPYTTDRGEEAALVLCEPSDRFPFHEKYPLYEAFCAYCAADPEDKPRDEMDEQEAARRTQRLGENDHLIGAQLQKKWNGKALTALRKELSLLPPEQQEALLRFHAGLVMRISKYEQKFSAEQWTRSGAENAAVTAASGATSGANASSAPLPPPPPPAARRWTVSPGGSDIYTVYEERSLQYAWNEKTQQWVQLNPNMWVLNSANQWEAIKLDASGNICN